MTYQFILQFILSVYIISFCYNNCKKQNRAGKSTSNDADANIKECFYFQPYNSPVYAFFAIQQPCLSVQ